MVTDIEADGKQEAEFAAQATTEPGRQPDAASLSVRGDLTALECRICWKFTDRSLLQEAVTHSTFANEEPTAGPNNERLEFLGDAVIDLIVANDLYQRQDMRSEGEMSRRRARVVRRESLAEQARDLDLGHYLRVGEGQRRSGATDNILADAYEALAGAVFLDGGYQAVCDCFGAVLRQAIDLAQKRVDHKTRLQEYCHLKRIKVPRYAVVAVEGPGHARVYSCKVSFGDVTVGPGHGSSKKAAEQDCACLALEQLI